LRPILTGLKKNFARKSLYCGDDEYTTLRRRQPHENGQNGVLDSKSVVSDIPLSLGHVIRCICAANHRQCGSAAVV